MQPYADDDDVHDDDVVVVMCLCLCQLRSQFSIYYIHVKIADV